MKYYKYMSVLEVDVRKHRRTGTKGFMIVQVSVSESLRASQPHPSHFLLAWRDRFLATICRLYSLYSSNRQDNLNTEDQIHRSNLFQSKIEEPLEHTSKTG